MPCGVKQWTDVQVAVAGVVAGAVVRDMLCHPGLSRWGHQVVCRYDVGPDSAVSKEGLPVSFIDLAP